MEQIYTIPVNEAFEKSAADKSCGCPFCTLYNKLECDELELILGASMMEPDVRIKTNERGFCEDHFSKMMTRKNRLGLALMLESHLDVVKEDIALGGLLAKNKAARPIKRIDELNKSCYVCERIEHNFANMIETAAVLYAREKEFREKFNKQKVFCLPHYRRLLECAGRLSKPYNSDLVTDASRIVTEALDKLRNDISWFCKKFDYRFENEPWYDSKDAIERTVAFLKSKE